MAVRPAWIIRDNKVEVEWFDFKWYSGFALSQVQRSVESLHNAIKSQYPCVSVLEVSTKGSNPLGNCLSAFNLTLEGIPLECHFQSSKVFENGGPYLDLLKVNPKDAKGDIRLKTSGKLVNFTKDGVVWPLLPKTAFYDYIYIKAVREKYGDNLDLKDYDYFTDIVFNPDKSINCQARALAIYKLMQQLDCFACMDDIILWQAFHKVYVIY